MGKGNFGRVFAARTEANENIAIKVAHPEVRDSEVMLESFRRGVESMRILAKSNLPGVVAIRDASELPPSIIMDYVEGIDFEKYAIDYSDISARQKIQIVFWICEILFQCHTHDRFVLHRDLRPSNIMISGEYWNHVYKHQIGILDFDLSWYKGAEGSEYYMNAAQALGYLAPEQLDTKSEYSTRSALVDVYGIGMLLYFILTIDVPLASASARADWPDRVSNAARKCYSNKWKSCVARMYDIIVSSTKEIQSDRISLQEVMTELGAILGIYDDVYPMDPGSILSEIQERLFNVGKDGIKTRRDGIFSHTTAAGVRLHAEVDSSDIKWKFEYVIAENSSRAGRAKFLRQSLDKASSVISSFANIDERVTGTDLGRSVLAFSTKLPATLRQLEELVRAVGNSVAELPVRA